MKLNHLVSHTFTFLLLNLLVFSFQLNAQHSCGAVYPSEPLRVTSSATNNLRSDPYIIPVLFHIYWDADIAPVAPTYVTDVIEQTNAFLRAENANLEFVPDEFQAIIGDAEIELQLAKKLPGNECTSGIIYHYHNFQFGLPGIFDNSIETSNYLNIHVLPLTNSYAILPASNQFINESYDCIGFSTYDINNRIEVLTHEIGHWFGLYHTFGQINSVGGDCGDDFVEDTPITRGSSACNLELIDCTPGVLENVNNFMDYTNCGSMFTAGQVQRMHGVIEDSLLNRNQFHQPENLLYTGVGETNLCARTTDTWHKSFVNCGSTTVRYSYLVQGQIPDSVLWEFYTIGPIPEYSSASMPTFSYTQSGLAIVYLWLYFGSESELVIINHQVEVNDIPTSMPEISEFPFELDPDDGLILPNENMNLLGAPLEEGWQICDFAGYQSNQCIYVPARVVDGEEVADLEIGMLNMSNLTQPTISFKVAAAMVTFGAYHTLEILFRDECNTAFVGDVWVSRPLFEIFNNNTSSGFIPNSDSQWVDVSVTFPEWTYASHAFITIRLRTIMQAGFSGEPFYLDDFRIGNSLITNTLEGKNKQIDNLLLYPNPAKNLINWTYNEDNVTHINVYDISGRLVADFPSNTSSGTININDWAPGFYQLMIQTKNGILTEKFVIE